MAGGIATAAALCTVTVSSDVLQKDPVLHVVLKLASPLQLHLVEQPKRKNVLEMKVGHFHLKQRNAIVRSLTGAALHGALDQAPLYLAGGCCWQQSFRSSSAAACSLGQQQQWMTVASKAATDPDLLKKMENLLTESAFLIPTASVPTVADMDVAWALRSTDLADEYPSVQRWLSTVLSVLADLAARAGVVEVNVPAQPPVAPAQPVFFYGSEDADEILRALHDKGKPKQGKKQQQQQGSKKEQQKQKQEKQVKAKKEQQAKGGAADQAPATYDVTALDIRVGKIVKVWPHEEAEKLYCEEIDLGPELKTRQIASGLRPFYEQKDLENATVVVLCNLKARNLVGFPSHGMVLCASSADHTAVELVVPPEGAAVGDRVTFGNLTGDPEPENKVAKKKIFEKVAPDLKTDQSGNVVWKEHGATIAGGPVKAIKGMASASVS
jgi:methionine--tRNA ligase beta chain